MIKYILIIVLLCSCYTERKAKGQFGKAVTSYPSIGAVFCAITYPCITDPVRSDTVTVYDTLWGETVRVLSDTVLVNDTVRITKTVQLPGKVITRTVTIRDTVKVKDQAALKVCELSRDEATRLQGEERAERLKYQARSRKYLYGLIGAGVLIGLWLFLTLRKRVKK